jgi:hypothetical protein
MGAAAFATLLGQHVQRTHNTAGRLAALSGLPKRTIVNWLQGLAKPRAWQDVLQLALALHLDASQTEALLLASGHPPLALLRTQPHLASADSQLLTRFATPTNGPATTPTHSPPFQAIAALPTFVGRQTQLAELANQLRTNGKTAICSIKGMGGVGKTSLAAHLAQHMRHEFPDGVLWARLDVSDSMAILATFAEAYGISVNQHRDLETRGSAVRNLLTNKRALIVLDNAEGSEQVRPLLPPSHSPCAILITTRNDLSITDGWAVLHLDSFDATSDEALKLFAQYLGPAIAKRQRTQLVALSQALGHLPLALAIVAGQLASRLRGREFSETAEAAEVAALLSASQAQSNLEQLQRDDHNVRHSFNLSFATLLPALKTFFAQLGVFGGEDFSLESVAFVSQTSPTQAQAMLEELRARSLVQISRNSRYGLHPLLMSYAREQLALQTNLDLDSHRRASDYFAAYAEQHKYQHHKLELEFDNMIYALRLAHTRRFEVAFFAGTDALQNFIEVRGFYAYGRVLYEQAIERAELLNDERALARALCNLAALTVRQSNYERTYALCERSLQLAERHHDKLSQAHCHRILSAASLGQGFIQSDHNHSAQGLALAREIGDQRLIGSLLINLGTAQVILGDFATGEANQLEGKRTSLEAGNFAAVVVACLNLGEFVRDQGRISEANAYFAEGLTLARQIGHREHQTNLLNSMGDTASDLGQFDEAEDLLQQAFALGNELKMPWMTSTTHILYAAHLLRQNQIDSLETFIEVGIATAQSVGANELVADGSFVRAKLRLAQGQLAQAQEEGEHALAMYMQQKHAKSRHVRAWLQGNFNHSG